MSYCVKCGSLMRDDDKFCVSCGTPLATAAPVSPVINQTMAPVYAPVSSLNQQERVRTDTLSELNRMINYFSLKQQQYDEYDKCSENIDIFSNPRARINVKTGLDGKPFIIAGAICAGVFMSFTYIALMLAGYTKNYGVPLLLFFITSLGIGSLVFGIIRNTKNNRIRNNYRLNMLSQNETRFAELANELSIYYQNYGYCPTGPSYTNPKILQKLRELVYLGRADTVKEAINIMHLDAHNSEMELQAANAARSAASAARGANTAAFFSAANFFLK